jgi:hypothetical protein
MALPTYFISSSIVNVDSTNINKSIILPPASTIKGVSLLVRDSAGACSATYPIYISTQGLDRMDRSASTITLSTAYQSVKLMAWGDTQYAILQNYTYGLTPFLVNFTQGIAWVTKQPTQLWRCVSSSSSGSVLLAGIAGGRLYRSIDIGNTWGPVGPSAIWYGVAMSSSGTNMVAVANGDRIYTSTNTGVSWTPRASSKAWTCVCSSSDGSVLLAGTTSDTLYRSTDSGVTWTSTNITANYIGVACSSNGSILYAVVSGGTIYVSTDTGATWTSRDSARTWTSIACTSDGTIAFATEGTYIYKSVNTGTSWTPNTSYAGGWRSVACSSTGTNVVAINASTGYVNFSDSSGVVYVLAQDPGSYQAIAMNGAGTQVLTGKYPGQLYNGFLQLL